MNYVKDPKIVGGMINSIGYAEQDCASIKYMFDYLEKGLKEISFESKDDFCMVLAGGEKIFVQVKINQFTLEYVAGLMKGHSINGKTIFVGSGYDDSFRVLLQDRNRYLDAKEGILCDDKKKLYKDIDDCCKKKKIDTVLFLQCDFMILDGINNGAIAKNAIDSWAMRKKLFVDTEALFNELVSLISHRLRPTGGHLSKNDIDEIIRKHRSSKIESFISKKNRISSVIEDSCRKNIFDFIDSLVVKYSPIKEKLLLIKYDLENDQLIEAKNRIEEILPMCFELNGVYLMVLNICGEYDTVIEWQQKMDKCTGDCIVEYAKAYMYKGDFCKSQNYIESIDATDWDSFVLYLSAINHHGMNEIEIAKKELKECIAKDDRFVDAYVFLASLIYVTETDLAVEYLDIALYIDPKCAKAHLLMALVSQLSDDFACTIENYEKYIEYSGDYENDSVLLDLARSKLHMGTDDWQLEFQKWNDAFRRNKKISGEVTVPVIDLGIHYSCTLILHSVDDGLTVFCDGQEIMSYRKGKTLSRTGLGLYAPKIDMEMHKFTLKDSLNPIKISSRNVFKETALPTIFKIYDDYESYEATLNTLLVQNVLHLNHKYNEYINEYIIESNDINIKIDVTGKKLTGDILIGHVDLKIEINPLTNCLDAFTEQLNRDCSFNEAAIILVCDEKHQTQLTFPKEKIHMSIKN
jgi:tetratricopeptide (TPR) repeat protein